MKILISFVLIVLALCSVSFAADCEEDGHKFNKGETYSPPGHCIQIECRGNGQTSALACGLIAKPPHCEFVPEDTTKPYPQCCASFKC